MTKSRNFLVFLSVSVLVAFGCQSAEPAPTAESEAIKEVERQKEPSQPSRVETVSPTSRRPSSAMTAESEATPTYMPAVGEVERQKEPVQPPRIETASPTSRRPLSTVTAESAATPTYLPTVMANYTQIPSIPGDNQLLNPYFEGEHNSTSIAGWQQTGQYDISIKSPNPSSSNTAARNGDRKIHGQGQEGVDAVIWQVVEGRGPKLSAEIQCVRINADVFQYRVYGSDNVDGPWTLVWATPFDISNCPRIRWPEELSRANTVLKLAYDYYKIEITTMYTLPDVPNPTGAIKFTNAFFNSQ